FIDHAAAGSRSREVYKGVLAGSSRGVFQGKILGRPDAQQTDGYQMNRAMLMSDKAEIDSKPELEIYADDVKCAHGATAGHTDPEALFYMQSRGIDEETAQAMLVRGFASEIADTIRVDALREYVENVIEETIPALQAAAD
ncbi:MAG: SufD family Fe-S cluster assembly protein, partial [Chloroflexi bacterium]|nr:SufD family Fe-S cluster assembly protein [Chloroflexota bacterium]